MKGFSIYILFIVSLLVGCTYEIEPDDSVDNGLDYYPLEVGRYSIFAVDDTIYDLFGEVSRTYQIKSVIADSFVTNDYTNYVVNNFTRINDTDAWQIDEVQMAKLINNQLVLQKNNESYSLLRFPVKEGLSWDGNTYNSLNEDIYEMNNVDASYQLVDDLFPITLTVVQHDNFDVLVETDYRMQVFAKEVGLIYNEIRQIKYCADYDCFGMQQIDEGIILKQRIIEYGKE